MHRNGFSTTFLANLHEITGFLLDNGIGSGAPTPGGSWSSWSSRSQTDIYTTEKLTMTLENQPCVKMSLLPKKMVSFFHCHRSFRGVPNTWPQTSGQIFLPRHEQAFWKRIPLPSPQVGGFPTGWSPWNLPSKHHYIWYNNQRYRISCSKIPIGSMYGIFTNIWLICMVNVGKYTIYGCYGICLFWETPLQFAGLGERCPIPNSGGFRFLISWLAWKEL